jgi:ribosome maturation factor RimP
MTNKDDIAKAVAEELGDGSLFVVEVQAAGDDFAVFIDSDQHTAEGRPRGVSVEDCVRLTRAIEARFDRDEDDFSLTVSSAGVGQPLKHPRQYRKLLGRTVEVVLNSGVKLIATLESADETGTLTLSYPEKQKIEGKKRPETVVVTKTFTLNEIKTTKEFLDFK